MFNSSASEERPTWAAVVRSGVGQDEDQMQRARDMELRIKADNKQKQLEKAEIERHLQQQQQELEEKETEDRENRLLALAKARRDAARAMEDVSHTGNASDTIISDEQLAELAPPSEKVVEEVISDQPDEQVGGNVEGNMVEPVAGDQSKVNSDLELIFGPGASNLAEKLQQDILSETSVSQTSDKNIPGTSTPLLTPLR